MLKRTLELVKRLRKVGSLPPLLRLGLCAMAKPARVGCALAVLLALSGCQTGSPGGGFVRVEKGRFVQHGRPLYFVGVNYWHAPYLGIEGADGEREQLLRELDELRLHGVTNIRVMAAMEGPDTEPYRATPAMMLAPGIYDERVLDGLDFLLAELAKRDMQAVLVLTNFWEWSGGMAQYVAWAEGSKIPYPASKDWREFMDYASRFYDCAPCQKAYRRHISKIVERQNPYTGRAYSDEPSIFAWELANEPRLYPESWIEHTAKYIRSLDPHHMITAGSEGRAGGPFTDTHSFDDIDYTTIHLWPQNWQWYDPANPETYQIAEKQTLDYINEHALASSALRKPMVIEAFGFPRDAGGGADPHDPAAGTTMRDNFFELIFGEVEASAREGGAIMGSNLWTWSGESRAQDRYLGDPPHRPPGWYSVYNIDQSTLDIIRRHAQNLKLMQD